MLAIGLVCGLVFNRSIRGGGPLLWDEGYHALWAERVAADMRAMDFTGVAYDLYRQVYWPPLWSSVLGAVFLVAKPSAALARSVGLAAFAALALALYWGGRRVTAEPHSRHLSGLLAAGAGALAGGTLLNAPMVMLDVPAAALLACTLVWYFRLLDAPHSRDVAWAALGALVMTTFLTKQNYGVLLGVSLAVAFVIDGEWYRRPSAGGRSRRRGHIVTGVTLAVLLTAWFGYPQKLVQTVWALTVNTWGPSRSSLEGVLFYPRAMPWLAGTWVLLAAWLVALAAALRPRELRDARVRTLVIMLALQTLFMEASPVKVERHLLALIPACAMLTASQARAWTKPVLGALLIVHFALVIPRVTPAAPSGTALLDVLRTEARNVSAPTLFIGSIEAPVAPPTIDLRLIEDGTLHVDRAGSLVNASEQHFAERMLSRFPAVIGRRLQSLFERWPGDEGNLTVYLGWPLDPAVQLRADGLAPLVRRIAGARPIDRIVIALPIAPQKPGLPTPARAAADLRAVGYGAAGEPFSVEGVDVRVLRRVPPA